MCRNLTHLTSLEVGVQNCSTESFIQLATNLGGQLKSLELDEGVEELNIDVFATVASHMVVLESLGIFIFPDGTLPLQPNQLILLGALSNLKELRIGCLEVDDATLSAWADGFGSKLEVLSLDCCEGLTSAGFLALVKEAHNLRIVHLTSGPSIDPCFQAVATNCPLLTEFYFACAKSYTTADGIQALVDGCPKLREMYLGWDSGWNSTLFGRQIKIPKYRRILFR